MAIFNSYVSLPEGVSKCILKGSILHGGQVPPIVSAQRGTWPCMEPLQGRPPASVSNTLSHDPFQSVKPMVVDLGWFGESAELKLRFIPSILRRQLIRIPLWTAGHLVMATGLHPGYESSQERRLPRAADAQYTQDARTSLVALNKVGQRKHANVWLFYRPFEIGVARVWRPESFTVK